MRPSRLASAVGVTAMAAVLLSSCSAASNSGGHGAVNGALGLVRSSPPLGARPSSAATGGRSAKATALGKVVPAATQLVVRTGSIALRVRAGGVVSAFQSVSSITLSLSGFVQSSSTGLTQQVRPGKRAGKGASLLLRVPTDSFASLERQVSGIGHVLHESSSGRDVTGESVNLTARITNLESEETALRRLMTRTGSIPNILAVQNELFGVEGEIEQLTAQSGLLLNQASYATLSVTIWPRAVPLPAAQKKSGKNSLERALVLAGHNCLAALRDLAIAVGWSVPLLALLLLAGGAWWFRRRLSRRRRAPEPTPAG